MSVEIVFYQDEDGTCPFIEWTNGLQDAAVDKMTSAVDDLERDSANLRRPTADYLREGIYELRIRFFNVHYRILYFFHNRIAAVVSHGIAKEGRVPDAEIDRAIERKRRFERDPQIHSYKEPDDDN